MMDASGAPGAAPFVDWDKVGRVKHYMSRRRANSFLFEVDWRIHDPRAPDEDPDEKVLEEQIRKHNGKRTGLINKVYLTKDEDELAKEKECDKEEMQSLLDKVAGLEKQLGTLQHASHDGQAKVTASIGQHEYGPRLILRDGAADSDSLGVSLNLPNACDDKHEDRIRVHRLGMTVWVIVPLKGAEETDDFPPAAYDPERKRFEWHV